MAAKNWLKKMASVAYFCVGLAIVAFVFRGCLPTYRGSDHVESPLVEVEYCESECADEEAGYLFAERQYKARFDECKTRGPNFERGCHSFEPESEPEDVYPEDEEEFGR